MWPRQLPRTATERLIASALPARTGNSTRPESAAAAAATKTPDSTTYVTITDNKVAIAYTSSFFQKPFF
jgi:hypothetical protein